MRITLNGKRENWRSRKIEIQVIIDEMKEGQMTSMSKIGEVLQALLDRIKELEGKEWEKE